MVVVVVVVVKGVGFSMGMGTEQGHIVNMKDFLVLMCLGLNDDASAGAG